jgi:hypothetical protein
VLDMALVRAADAIDIYLRMSRRCPALIQHQDLKNAIDTSQNRILQKLKALHSHYSQNGSVLFAMGFVMVAWRNRSAHAEADTEVSEVTRNILHENSLQIAAEYNGLSVDRLLRGFENSAPTFKEMASLISASHKLVALIENLQFRSLDGERFLRELVWYSTISDNLDAAASKKARMRRFQGIWGKDISDRGPTVIRTLINCGLSLNKRDSSSVELDGALIQRVTKMTPTQVFEWAKPDLNAV